MKNTIIRIYHLDNKGYQSMTLQFRVISAIIFVAVLLIAILSGLGLRQSDRLIDQTVTSQLQQHLHTLSANIEAETRRAETLALLVSGDKAVIDATDSQFRAWQGALVELPPMATNAGGPPTEMHTT